MGRERDCKAVRVGGSSKRPGRWLGATEPLASRTRGVRVSPRSVRVVARPRGAADRRIRPPQLIAPSRPGWPRVLDRGDQSLASYPRDTRRGARYAKSYSLATRRFADANGINVRRSVRRGEGSK